MMNDLAVPVNFRLKGLTTVLSVFFILAVIFGTLGLIVMAQEGFVNGGLVLAGIEFPVILCGGVFLVGKSNIVISDSSISRYFWGRKIQEIEWSNVQKVKVFTLGGGASRKGVLGYNVIRSPASRAGFLQKKIWFSERPDDIAGLIDAINLFIERFKIDVEKNIDGMISTPTRI